jgi:hypothetical protein
MSVYRVHFSSLKDAARRFVGSLELVLSTLNRPDDNESITEIENAVGRVLDTLNLRGSYGEQPELNYITDDEINTTPIEMDYTTRPLKELLQKHTYHRAMLEEKKAIKAPQQMIDFEIVVIEKLACAINERRGLGAHVKVTETPKEIGDCTPTTTDNDIQIDIKHNEDGCDCDLVTADHSDDLFCVLELDDDDDYHCGACLPSSKCPGPGVYKLVKVDDSSGDIMPDSTNTVKAGCGAGRPEHV